MNRKGPWPLIITGTTTRPMWSRVVGDANSSASLSKGSTNPGSTAAGSTASSGAVVGEAPAVEPPANNTASKHTLHRRWWGEGAILRYYTPDNRTPTRGT